MRGLRRRVGGRASVALLLPVLVAAIVLLSGGVALADQWSDISDSTWANTYGVTPAQAAVVSDGFTDGTFRPKQSVTRGQFAKFTVDGFGIATSNPPAKTFRDVATNSTFYIWIEGGVKAGVLAGFTDGTYKPNSTISRQQSNNILGSYLSKKELSQKGTITGSKGTYSSLTAWYAAEGPAILATFKDATAVAAVHAPGTAYLVYHQVVKGSNGNLTPGSSLTRAQAVALIVRVKAVTFNGGGTGSLPVVSMVNPAAGAAAGGNNAFITGTNFTGVTAVKFGNTPATSYTVNSAQGIAVVVPAGVEGSTVDVTVTTAAGTSVVSNNSKYSYGLPTVTKLEPDGGSGAGGTAVTITGTGFTGVTYVRFGTQVATNFVVLNPTTITAVSPAGTTGTTVDVVVTTSAGSSVPSAASKFTYGVPTVTKLQPAAGPAVGGNDIVITGTGFTEISGPAGVKFVGATTTVNATSYTVNSSIQITAKVPAGTDGTTVDVVVTNTVGSSGMNLNSKYSYGAPTITKLNPTGGKETGGDLVTITGTGFTGVTSVKFGNTTLNASAYVVDSPTQISVKSTPAGTVGTTVEVTVTTPAGTNPTASTLNDYTYGLPTVTNVNPAAGPITSGQTVIITGANFTGATAVKFGTLTVAYTVNSATQITATAPGGTAGETVEVTVITAAGTSAPSAGSKYSYGAPQITKLEPSAGPTAGGTSVKITGKGFTGVTAVRFGGSNATFTVDSPTQITAVTPIGNLNSTVDVVVTTPAGNSVAGSTSKFSYIGLPTVTGLNPATGPTTGGNTVTITGTYFVTGTTVKFGANSATNVTVVSDTEMTVTAPAGTGSVSVSVTNPAGVSSNTSADDYMYGMPRITGLNPSAGNAGETVIITGSGFVNITQLKFGDVPVDPSKYTVNSQTQITAVAPAQTSDKTVDVTVTNSVGTSEKTDSSKYAYGAPVITSISPTGGSAGATVTIYGHGFTGTTSAMTVTFTGNGATGSATATITEIDKTNYAYIKVTAPAQGIMTNPVKVTVATAAGVSAVGQNFSYGVPTITSVSPAAGQLSGGENVIITGTGFTSTSKVYFGGTKEATVIGIPTATQIIVATPQATDVPGYALVTPTVAVSVTNDGGTSNNADSDLKNKYTYGLPVVSSFTPNSGPSAAGTEVKISGRGFTGVSSVMFGANAATNVVVDSATQITVRAPSGTGLVPVTVTTPAGTGTGANYQYGRPVVATVSPASGPATGNTPVVITGSGFSGASQVRFASSTVMSTNFTVNLAGTQITLNTPAHDAGTVFVTVVNGLESATNDAATYTYGPPSVYSLSPSGGSTSGGDLVTINGAGFNGVTSVRFGGTSVAYTRVSVSQITATAPAGSAGTVVDVTVTTYTGAISPTSAGSKYSYGSPSVTNVSPAAGQSGGGTAVVITGTSFSASGITEVKFGAVNASWSYISPTQIAATSPPGVGDGTVDVVIWNGAGSSGTSANTKYTYGKPNIDLVSPSSGSASGGTSVTITGAGFTGVTDVSFGATSVPFTVISPTQINVTAPAGTVGTQVDVKVTTTAGWDLENDNYYGFGRPVVTSLNVQAGPVGGTNTLTITGSNFKYSGTTTVMFGHTPGTGVIVNDTGTQLTVTVPARNATLDPSITVDVIVWTGAGDSANTKADDYTYGVPQVTNVTPTSGPANVNGNIVYITGVGFTGTLTVTFGGSAGTIDAANSTPTLLRVYAPFHGAGTVPVVVSNVVGPSVDVVTYTYQ